MKFARAGSERCSVSGVSNRCCGVICARKVRDATSAEPPTGSVRGPATRRASAYCCRPLTLFALLGLVGFAQAHQYSLGACPPEVPFKKSFDVDRFLGVWFVIQKSHSTMSCLKVNITRRGDEDFKITEYRRFGLLQKAVDHTLIDVGVLKIPDPTEPAKMNVKFSLSVSYVEPSRTTLQRSPKRYVLEI